MLDTYDEKDTKVDEETIYMKDQVSKSSYKVLPKLPVLGLLDMGVA